VTQQGTAVSSYTLGANANPSNGGTISLSPSQIAYVAGAQVTLTAAPNSGFTFTGWTGDASGSDNPLTVTMNTNKTITANFTGSPTYALSVSFNPKAGGSVAVSPNLTSFASGTSVTLTAVPNSGYAFSNWTGDASGTSIQTHVLIDRNRSVTANFVASEAGPTGTSFSFLIADRGELSTNTLGNSAVMVSGYGQIEPGPGSTTPSGVAIYAYRPGNYLVSEVGVPATTTLTAGRIYAEINGSVNTGLAIVNPNNQTAIINFFYTDAAGNDLGLGATTLSSHNQIAQFLNVPPFKTFTGDTFQGTFSFTSNMPVAAVALRGFVNERGDFLMSTLPVIDASAGLNTSVAAVPHFADGDGWTTQVLLVNPTSNTATGTIEFRDDSGALVNVPITGQNTNAYSIPARSSQKLVTAGTASVATTGSVRITPENGGPAPVPLVVFSYKPEAIIVSEAGVPTASGTAFRMYAESSGIPSERDNIQTGIAVTNNGSSAISITFELFNSDGSTSGLPTPVTTTLQPLGHVTNFLANIFAGQSFPNPFRGVLRISTPSPSGVSVAGLRTHYNELLDFLITTIPAMSESAPLSSSLRFFPQWADGGGYTTKFILFSGAPGQSGTGTLTFFSQSGQPLSLILGNPVGISRFGEVSDPSGDAISGRSDLIHGSVLVAGESATMVAQFAPGTFDRSKTAVTFDLDLDENPATGHPGIDSTGIPDRDLLGIDFFVQLDALKGRATVFKYGGSPNVFTVIGDFPLVVNSDSIETTIPLSLIGQEGDGRMAFKCVSFEHITTTSFTQVLDVMPDVGLRPGVVR